MSRARDALNSPSIAPFSSRLRAIGAPLCLTAAVLQTACILDLEGLTGGAAGSTSSGGTTSTSAGGAGGSTSSGGSTTTSAGGTTTTSAGGSTATCGVLDCCPADAPTMIVGPDKANLPRELLVRPEGLYWANFGGDSIARLPASGGAVETLASAMGPRAIAASGDKLVWTARDGVYGCTLPGCDDAAQIVASLGTDSVRDVAFDGVTLVYTDRGATDYDGRARSCKIAACDPIDLNDGQLNPQSIVLDGSHATWTEQGNGNDNGSVWRSPKDSAAAMQVAWSLRYTSGVATDDSYVYWTEEAAAPSGHVTYCTIGQQNCATRVAEAPPEKPTNLLIAAGRVYITSSAAGTIASCPQPTCGAESPKTHVTGRVGLTKIAVNATCLFWSENAGGGAIYKIAR